VPRVSSRENRIHHAGKIRNKHLWLWFPLAIVVLSIALYINTLENSYVLDDKGIITENEFTSRGFSGIPDLLTTSYWEGVGINVRSYRPLAPVTFAIEVGTWGKNPMISHFFNLVIYLLTGVILLFFLKRFFEKIDPAITPAIPFITTILFLAHPIHTEVVANIKSRDAMFELLFLLLSVHFLFRHIETHKIRDLAVSVAFFFPAMLSKESAVSYIVMVPVILILFDDRSFRTKMQITLVYLIPVIFFLILYLVFSDFSGFVPLNILNNSLVSLAPATEIWATKFLIPGKYLVLLAFPHPLVYDYSYNQIPLTGFSNPAVWFSMVIYFSASIFLVSVLFKRLLGKIVPPWNLVVSFSVAWFIMGFFASSNLLILIGSTMGERFMYSSSLGFILVMVYGFYRLVFLLKQKKKFSGVVVVMIIYLLGLILFSGYFLKTIDRNKAWKNDLTLCLTDIKYLGENAKANEFLSNFYEKQGDEAIDREVKKSNYKKAIELKEKAVFIYPESVETQQQLGYLYGKTGQFEKAIEKYKFAIRLNPREISNYVQIGKAYGMVHRVRDGLVYLEKGEKINPGNAELLVNMGIAYAQTGEMEKAVIYFEKAHARDTSNKKIADYLTFAKNRVDIHKK
jgi:Flp pilus assembly protein TadD